MIAPTELTVISALPRSTAPSRPAAWMPAARVVIVVGALMAAFWPTVVALATGALPGVTTGQGFLGMVLVAVGVTAGINDSQPHGVDIHDREMDAIVGSLFLAISLGFTWLLPSQMGDLVPLWRPDLLGAATFLTGALCLMVGVRQAGRCWPALLGIALVHPVVVELLLAPVMANFTRAGASLAGWVVGATVTTEGGSGVTVWLTDSGVFRALELDQAVSSFALVPLAAVVLIATAVVLYGRYTRRLLLVPLGTALLTILLTTRLVTGVVLARSSQPGQHEWVLGFAGTLALLAVTTAGTVLMARRLQLTWSPPATAEATGRHLAMPVAAAILGAGTLAVALFGGPAHADLAPLARAPVSSTVDFEKYDFGAFGATASTSSPSPYSSALSTGTWRRVEYEAADRIPGSSGDAPLILDVIDVPNASMLALYPPRELYGSVPHDRALHRTVSLAPGLDAVATTYLGMNGRPVMSVLTWAWQTTDGEVQQISLLLMDDPVAAAPVPTVDFSGSLLPNIFDSLRGADIIVPEATRAQQQRSEDLLLQRGRQLVTALEAT